MDTTILKQLVKRQNEQLEEQAIQKATRIIQSISELQAEKVRIDRLIADYRTELKALQIQQIDEISILGN